MNAPNPIDRKTIHWGWVAALAIVGMATALLPLRAVASGWNEKPRADSWVTDGTVNSMTRVGDTLYLGGYFTRLGPYTGAGVPVDTASAQPVAPYPRVDGTIRTAIVDGADGWFIGGDFTTVEKTARHYIAHIRADGTLDPAWNPGANGQVRALLLSGSTLFVGGDFTTIGGQARVSVAALDAATGQPTDWAPTPPNGLVSALGLMGTTLFVGGGFTAVDIYPRHYLASYDTAATTSTLPLPFYPWLDGPVYSMCVVGATVYVGGAFQTANGGPDMNGDTFVDRNNLAAFDGVTGTPVASWDPQTDGPVYTMAPVGSTLYVGGAFSTIDGISRASAAAVGLGDGVLASWNPNVTGLVTSLLADGATIYVGGDYTKIHAVNRSYLAALDATTAEPTAWAPEPNSSVNALALNGSRLYVGGAFSSLGGVARKCLAAVNAVDDQPTAFRADADSTVYALEVRNHTLYAAGGFRSLGGASRTFLGAVDTSTSLTTAWAPSPDYPVETLVEKDGIVYVGGAFTTIGTDARNRLAAISATTGLVTPWDPSADNTVHALGIKDSRIYAAGDFWTIGAASRTGIAALDLTTGLADSSWDAHSNAGVLRILPTGSSVYVAGNFLVIGGQKYHYFSRLTSSDATAGDWDPRATGTVLALALSGPDVLVGGSFTNIGLYERNGLAAISATNGFAKSWNPNVDGIVYAIGGVTSTTIWVGGNFQSVGQAPRRSLAQFEANYDVQFVTDGSSGSSLTGDLAQVVSLGDDATTVTAVPPEGYHFVRWNLDGAAYSKKNPLQVKNVRRDMLLVALFSSTYLLTFTTDDTPGAELSGLTFQSLAAGADASPVTAIEPAGYNFLNWTLDGDFYSLDNPLTITDVHSDMALVAVFSATKYTVNFLTGAVPGTTLTGVTPQIVEHGTNCTPVRVNPPRGYRFVKWTADGVDYSTANPVTVQNVTHTMVLTPVLSLAPNAWIVQ